MIWELQITLPALWSAAVQEWLLAEESMGASEDGVDQPQRILRGYFDDSRNRETLVQGLNTFLATLDAPPVTPLWTQLQDQDWQEGWKEHIQPIPVGQRLLILPTWRERPNPAPELVIRLDPEMAFGSGSHETTHGCLAALETLANAAPLGQVLDLGTGSGILAIAAALLGARSVLATDNDPVATSTCLQNAERNGVTPLIQVEERETVPTGPFDTVVANILASVLLELCPSISRALAPGGRLILSGILNTEAAEVAAAYQAAGLREIATTQRGEWTVWMGQDTRMAL